MPGVYLTYNLVLRESYPSLDTFTLDYAFHLSKLHLTKLYLVAQSKLSIIDKGTLYYALALNDLNVSCLSCSNDVVSSENNLFCGPPIIRLNLPKLYMLLTRPLKQFNILTIYAAV